MGVCGLTSKNWEEIDNVDDNDVLTLIAMLQYARSDDNDGGCGKSSDDPMVFQCLMMTIRSALLRVEAIA